MSPVAKAEYKLADLEASLATLKTEQQAAWDAVTPRINEVERDIDRQRNVVAEVKRLAGELADAERAVADAEAIPLVELIASDLVASKAEKVGKAKAARDVAAAALEKLVG